jgi:hypothetical protein
MPVVQQAEPFLTTAATQFDLTDLGKACDRIRAHVDPDGPEPNAGADFARRGIRMSELDGMLLIRGQLDPEGGATLTAALPVPIAQPVPTA